MTAHWHYSGPKADHAGDIAEELGVKGDEAKKMVSALMKMSRNDIKNLYHYILEMKTRDHDRAA